VGAAVAECGAGANAEEQNLSGSAVSSPVGETPSSVVLPVAVFEVDPYPPGEGRLGVSRLSP